MAGRLGEIKGPEENKSGLSFRKDLGMHTPKERTGLHPPRILNIKKLIMRGFTKKPKDPETIRPETSAGAMY